MNKDNLESLEADLRKVRPANPPEAFLERVHHAVHAEFHEVPPRAMASQAVVPVPRWRLWLKWSAPLAAAAAVVALALLAKGLFLPGTSPSQTESISTLPIDEVVLDQHLLAAFEGVAQVPGGPPVRFRCYGWQEALTVRNQSGAIEVEQPVPRFEIVPIGFDVY